MNPQEPGHLSQFLSRVINQEIHTGGRLTAKRLAQRMGITPAMMTRFLSGESKYCYPKTLCKMIEGISPHSELRAELLRSYLLDQRPPNTEHLVEIHIANEPDIGALWSLSDLARSINLTPDMVAALGEIIRACGRSRHMARLVADLGHLAAHHLNESDALQQRRQLRVAEQPPVYQQKPPNT